jgi:uncharacterized repeat protein (TIGR01451 family)
VTETPQGGYTPGRPGPNNDWTCTFKNPNGSSTTTSGDFAASTSAFTIGVDPNQIITCKVYNSFDYHAAISLTKVDTPTQVRGDISPPGNTVTSTFNVTNPGNTPLAQISLVDTRCAPTRQSGDTNNDGLLAPNLGETWVYTCTRNLDNAPGSPPLTVTNTAGVTGVDPTGALLTAGAQATVNVYAPQVTLTKTASPTKIQVGVPTNVAYTYVAANTGNMTLTNVSVTDSAVPVAATCGPVLPASVATLAPGASTTFTCTKNLTATGPADTFVNTATVTADPVFPNAPTAAPPPVTAKATAQVTAFQVGIDLTKTVDQAVVFPNTLVHYTYAVRNSGTVPLIRTGPNGSPDPRDGRVDDSRGPTGTCAPVEDRA